MGASGSVIGWGTMIQAGRSRFRFPIHVMLYQLYGDKYTYGIVMYPQSVVELRWVWDSVLCDEHGRIVVLILDPLQ
jgi:hypothetical protein